MSVLVVFAGGRWLSIDDATVASRGDVLADAPLPGDEDRVVAIVPGRDCTIGSAVLPDLADAQARAAARIAAGEASAALPEALHIGVGEADELGVRTVVAVEAVLVTERLLSLAAAGLDPDHLLAAPLLLPRPLAGYVRGDLGDEIVFRGNDSAFADDAVLTPLIVDGQDVETLDRAALEDALILAVANPEADLRQGLFAKRRKWAIEVARLRRLATIALVMGLLVLATHLVAIVRLNAKAAQIESDNRIAAVAVLPAGSIVTDPVAQVGARLTALQGAGGGFGTLAAAFAAATNATPNVELGSMVFDGQGGLRATVRASSAADLSAIEERLVASGLVVLPGPIVSNQGKPYRDVTVSVR